MGAGSLFQDSKQLGRLLMRMTRLDPSKRVAASILPMHSAARQVCLPAGGDHLDRNDGAIIVLDALKNYFAPEAAVSIYQEVVRCLQYRRTGQTIDG